MFLNYQNNYVHFYYDFKSTPEYFLFCISYLPRVHKINIEKNEQIIFLHV